MSAQDDIKAAAEAAAAFMDAQELQHGVDTTALAVAEARIAELEAQLSPGGLLGAFTRPKPTDPLGKLGEQTRESITALETQVGHTLGTTRNYLALDEDVDTFQKAGTDTGMIEWQVKGGRVPHISIHSWTGGGDPVTGGAGQLVPWADVAQGKYDALLTMNAQKLARIGGPYVLSWNHEPENDACGTAGQFGDAYHHVRSIMDAAGVKAHWTLVLMQNEYATNPGPWYANCADDVDWIGVDCYNRYPEVGKWKPVPEILASAQTFADAAGKPLFVGEWASLEDPDQPNRKGDWIIEALDWLASNKAAGACYSHTRATFQGHTMFYWLDTSAYAFYAFKAAMESSYWKEGVGV